jgi:hypothetical protein
MAAELEGDLRVAAEGVFRVTGSVTATGSCATDLSGSCDFTYQGHQNPVTT